jgi:hypothetical protein
MAGLPRRERGKADDGIIDYSCILRKRKRERKI